MSGPDDHAIPEADAAMRLLLVEDSARLRGLLREAIETAGWRLDACGDAESGEAAARAVSYDLALVDLGLPDRDGIDLIRRLRSFGFRAPILILTARTDVDDRVTGLDAGADDYLVKPFNNAELLARCRALARRAPDVRPAVISVGRLTLDPATQVLAASGAPVTLAPRERMLAELLMRRAGRVVRKAALEEALSTFGSEVSTNAVELAVSRFRKALDGHDTGVVLDTVRGVGYLLREAGR